ncbi:MAG: hypothetical protein A3H96_03815 [Acidobacteria bacterium RIFCSPLOWO2_02_FULL_67_36]|nr:MAG: hypothetical protein A3H96_03815 [Acidobacteria bacterium RIFCSPLOWO2_02_FULL_67_36]OFW21718.1 MAG: hypothetical protein A3G21_15110 [Acidobacteria bacterium RIFCSPLOWO2_12_FULL_66_21]
MRTLCSILVGLCAVSSAGASADAGLAPRIVATPVPAATAIRLDGDLNDDVWQRAPVINGFRQREPRDGAAPTFETEARVAYDDGALYIAVQAFDPERVVGIRTRRDASSPSDWISVIVDSFHDRRSGFEFAVNPAGVKQDAYWFNDASNDQGWDAVWDVAVSRGDRGWRAEFRIPFSQLRYHPSNDATFGLAITRRVARLNETTTWPLLSKSANGYVSSFGELTGLRLDKSPKRLEVVPYVVGDVKTQPVEAGNPLAQAKDPTASVGVDLKYAVRPGLTFTGTVNPDFGQVEADPAVVNLSAFETFFSERRPFFVEGSGIFKFDVDCNDGACSGLFYSRRIGRSPRGEADVPGGGFASAPLQTTILGAGKLTGRVGKFSIGGLTAITADEHAQVASGALRSRQTIEPLTGYSVLRARREFVNQSTLGFIATSTNRRLDAATRFLPGQAYTGGLDLDWRLNKKYSVQGFLAGSSVRGDADAIASLQQSNVHSFQRPDSGTIRFDPSRTSLNGYGGSLSINKIGGEKVRFTSVVGLKSPGFDINDVGFMRRADQKTISNWIQVRYDKPSRYLRSFRYNLNQWAGWNYDGDRLMNGGNVNAHAVFANMWSTGMGVNVNSRNVDDRATRGGPAVRTNPERSVWGYVQSDERKALGGGLNVFFLSDLNGTRYRDISPMISFRPSSFLTLSGGLGFSQNRDESQWIEQLNGDYVFGRLDQKTVSLTARVNYTVTPSLSIQIYAQPFVSAGAYSHFKRLVDGRAASYAARFEPTTYGSNPDFNYRSFRTTNVLRWEYKPGSALFLVWQQGREAVLNRGTFNFSRDFGGVFDAPSRNVFLIKWSYWLNY